MIRASARARLLAAGAALACGATALAGCGDADSPSAPRAATDGEVQALADAATMLDARDPPPATDAAEPDAAIGDPAKGD